MHSISQELINKFKVRKSSGQKTEFLVWAKKKIGELGYSATIEEGGSFSSRNLVVGDVSTADFIFTAHYDTPAMNLFPFMQMPQSIIMMLLYNLARYGLLYVISLIISIFFVQYVNDSEILMLVVRYAVFLLLIINSVAGLPNKNNMNDNTSGVIELFELMAAMPEQYKDRVAFVFFDNAEKCLAGSQAFLVKHGEEIYKKLLVNFDCLAVGDYVVMFAPKMYRHSNKFNELMSGAFGIPDGKRFALPFKVSLYPSDHMVFPRGVSIATFKRKKLFGYCFGRIHTFFDRKLDERNIEVVRDMMVNMISGKSIRTEKPQLTREQIQQIIEKPDKEKTMTALETMFRE